MGIEGRRGGAEEAHAVYAPRPVTRARGNHTFVKTVLVGCFWAVSIGEEGGHSQATETTGMRPAHGWSRILTGWGARRSSLGGGVPEAPRASGLERAGCRRRPPNGGKPTGPARGGGGRRPGSLHLGTAQSCLRRVMPATAAVSGTDWRHPLPIRLCGRVGPGERVVAPHGATVVATAVVATTTVAAFVTVPGSPPRSMCLRCTRS